MWVEICGTDKREYWEWSAILNELDWINRDFPDHQHLSYEAHDSIFHFAPIWNVFETEACGRKANKKSMEDAVELIVSKGMPDLKAYQKIVEYFKLRYENGTNHLFRTLFEPTAGKDSQLRAGIQKLMEDRSYLDPKCQIVGLLFIAYRIRNNLFHGNKGIPTVRGQNELFQQVNQLLIRFVDDYRRARSAQTGA